MGKSRPSSEERRQQIIDTAAEVFSIHGVDGTRTRDIAEACQINEALIYKHFSSKDDLYRSAMIHSYDKAVERIAQTASVQPNGLLSLIVVLRAQLDLLSMNPALSANMWHAVATSRHDSKMRDLVNDRFGKLHRFLRSLVEKGQADGSVRTDIDPERVTWFVRGLTWIFILRTILDPEVGDTADEPFKFCRTLMEHLAADSEAARQLYRELYADEAGSMEADPADNS